MKITYLLAVLLIVPSFAAQAHVGTRSAVGSRLHGYRIEGREIVAPPWSFACINDQGPKQFDEPMWVYGSPDYLAQFKLPATADSYDIGASDPEGSPFAFGEPSRRDRVLRLARQPFES
jgi:hypothetical protein